MGTCFGGGLKKACCRVVNVPLPGCNLRRNAGSVPVGHWAVMARKAAPPSESEMNSYTASTTCDISTVVLVIAMAVTITMRCHWSPLYRPL